MDESSKKFKYTYGIDAAMDVIGGKWKPLIIYHLKEETLRFSQIMERIFPKITQRMLTKELRNLEQDGLITRKVFAEVPPRVEYSLTERGASLIPIFDQLCEWGYTHMGEDIEIDCRD
jgi:DNA-binding HxlR family transcriptional regulator